MPRSMSKIAVFGVLAVLLMTLATPKAMAETPNATLDSWPIALGSVTSVLFPVCGSLFHDGKYYLGTFGDAGQGSITSVDASNNEVKRWGGGGCIQWSQTGLPADTIPFADPNQGILGTLDTSTDIFTGWQTGLELKRVVALGPSRLFGVTDTRLVAVDQANNELTEYDLGALGLGSVAGVNSVVPLTALRNGQVATVLSDGKTLNLVLVNPATSEATSFELPYDNFNPSNPVSNLVADNDNRVYGAVHLDPPVGGTSSIGAVSAFRFDPETGELLSMPSGAWQWLNNTQALAAFYNAPMVAVSPDGSVFYVHSDFRWPPPSASSPGNYQTVFVMGPQGPLSQTAFHLGNTWSGGAGGHPAVESADAVWQTYDHGHTIPQASQLILP